MLYGKFFGYGWNDQYQIVLLNNEYISRTFYCVHKGFKKFKLEFKCLFILYYV